MNIKKLENKLSREDIELSSKEADKLIAMNKLKLDMAVKYSCNNCCRTNKDYVWPEGSVNSKLMFVTAPPTEYEAKTHTVLSDLGGSLFTVMLNKLNLNRDSVYITPICKCCLSKYEDIGACFASYVLAEINLIKPKFIATLGQVAANVFRDFLFDRLPLDEDLDDIKNKPYNASLNGLNFTVFHMLDPNEVISKPGTLYNNYKTSIWQEINYCIKNFNK